MPQITTTEPHLIIQHGNFNVSHILSMDVISSDVCNKLQKLIKEVNILLIYKNKGNELRITQDTSIRILMSALINKVNVVDKYLIKNDVPI